MLVVQGGWRTGSLGVLLHFAIATSIVAVACLTARRWPSLVRVPLLAGALYGIAVWLVMNFAVIPLSAAVSGPLRTAVGVNGILIHIVGVGTPAVLFARAAASDR